MLSADELQQISEILDKKLDPIKADIEVMKTDIDIMKLDIDEIKSNIDYMSLMT